MNPKAIAEEILAATSGTWTAYEDRAGDLVKGEDEANRFVFSSVIQSLIYFDILGNFFIKQKQSDFVSEVTKCTIRRYSGDNNELQVNKFIVDAKEQWDASAYLMAALGAGTSNDEALASKMQCNELMEASFRFRNTTFQDYLADNMPDAFQEDINQYNPFFTYSGTTLSGYIFTDRLVGPNPGQYASLSMERASTLRLFSILLFSNIHQIIQKIG